MATSTRQARKDAERLRQDLCDTYDDWFRSLFSNSVVVDNLPLELPKRYLLKTLYEQGRIGYDKQTHLFLPCTGVGVDAYGLPTAYNLVGYNGLVLHRKADEVDILRINDTASGLMPFVDLQINKIVEFDITIRQNLDAIKTMTIAEVADRATLLSMANIAESRQIGATIAFVNKSANLGNNIATQPTGAQFLVDKLQQARAEVIDEVLQYLGTSVANTEKRERVQTAEVNASQGLAVDCISVMIDTFNHDAEIAGLDLRLRANTSLMKDRATAEQEVKNERDQ